MAVRACGASTMPASKAVNRAASKRWSGTSDIAGAIRYEWPINMAVVVVPSTAAEAAAPASSQGSGPVGVVAILTQASERMVLPSHLPLFRPRRPMRAWSRAEMNMPPPQWPPPLTTWMRLPSTSVQLLS